MEQLAKNLKEAMSSKGVSAKWLAENANVSEKTIGRILKGDHKGTSAESLLRISDALNVSTDFLLKGTNVMIGTEELQELNVKLAAELAELMDKLVTLETELSAQKDTVATLTAENSILRLKLEHKEEIISIHNYYISKESKN